MLNKKILKIIVPIVMVCIVGGIWFFQTQQDSSENAGADSYENGYPLNVTSVDLEGLKQSGLPIIIDFGADECVPCKEMAPVLLELNEKLQGVAIIQFVDVWKNPEAAEGFPVQVIPTQIIVNADGTPYLPSGEVGAVVDFSMYGDKETQEHLFTVHQGGFTEEEMRLILSDMGADS